MRTRYIDRGGEPVLASGQVLNAYGEEHSLFHVFSPFLCKAKS